MTAVSGQLLYFVRVIDDKNLYAGGDGGVEFLDRLDRMRMNHLRRINARASDNIDITGGADVKGAPLPFNLIDNSPVVIGLDGVVDVDTRQSAFKSRVVLTDFRAGK
jgi:hypothetical protein